MTKKDTAKKDDPEQSDRFVEIAQHIATDDIEELFLKAFVSVARAEKGEKPPECSKD